MKIKWTWKYWKTVWWLDISNEMFPPLSIAPEVCLREADGFQKSGYSSLHSSRLLFFSSFFFTAPKAASALSFT